MSEIPTNAEGAPVTDHRPVPRGVLPRGMQTWLMVGVAVGMVAIIVGAGRPNPPARPAPMAATSPAPNPDRVRDYQDRLRVLETRAAQETRAAAMAPTPTPLVNDEPPSAQAQDPLIAERKRRDYESLFASNVVLSRRPEPQRPDAGRAFTPSSAASTSARGAAPSIDEIAEAAVRATSRANPAAAHKVSESKNMKKTEFRWLIIRSPSNKPK